MKIFITTMLLLLLSSSAWGYSKKIIFSSFTTKEGAEKSLSKFLSNSKKSGKLSSLAEKNSFEVRIRQSGKYYIIVAEPITSKSLAQQTIKALKGSYKQAYANNYTAPKTVQTPKELPIEEPLAKTQELNISQEEPLKEEIVSHPVVTQAVDENRTKKESATEVLENNSTKKIKEKEVKKEIETLYKEDKIDFELIFKWLLLIVILSTMIFYFIKFKRIYDEY